MLSQLHEKLNEHCLHFQTVNWSVHKEHINMQYVQAK